MVRLDIGEMNIRSRQAEYTVIVISNTVAYDGGEIEVVSYSITSLKVW